MENLSVNQLINKFNKEDLAKKVFELQNLSTTVGFKNKEITKIKEEHKLELESKMKDAIGIKDREIGSIKNQFEELSKKFDVAVEIAEKSLNRHVNLVNALDGLTQNEAELLGYAKKIAEVNLGIK